MKRLAIVLAALCLFTAPAGAQVFGQFHPAHPLRNDSNMWGAYLLLGAAEVRANGGEVLRADVTLATGTLFCVREHSRTIVATTGPEPTAGLVVYDLSTVLRRIEEAPA